MTAGVGYASPRCEVAGPRQDAQSLLADRVRRRLGLGPELDDDAIVASLSEVERAQGPMARLQAALDSTLGHWLALSSCDVPAALATLVGMVAAERN